MPLLLQGTPFVLRETFVPQQVSDATRSLTGARVFPGVPFMFEHFADHRASCRGRRRCSALISAGAPLDCATTVRAFFDAFGVKIHSFYGTSETGGIAFDEPTRSRGETSVGRPLPGVHDHPARRGRRAAGSRPGARRRARRSRPAMRATHGRRLASSTAAS